MLTNFVVSEKNRTFAISKHLNMITFDDLETLKETYDKGKYDIFYENGNIRYEVRHLGSTLFCYNVRRDMVWVLLTTLILRGSMVLRDQSQSQ